MPPPDLSINIGDGVQATVQYTSRTSTRGHLREAFVVAVHPAPERTVTPRKPPDPAGDWLTVDQAAAYAGLSTSGFRGLAEAENLDVRRRGRRPGVLRADLDAYLERARIQPGTITGVSTSKGRYEAHERYARDVDGYVPGLAEVDRLHGLGWNDTAIAHALGMHFSNVSRRRVNGFSTRHIAQLRRLALGGAVCDALMLDAFVGPDPSRG
jgi:hypothetical protein